MEQVIEVKNLVKRYGSLTAVDNISFSVHRNEIFGILGPNGAGKTTTLEIIEGLQHLTSGSAFVLGMDTRRGMAQVKERVGVQLQASAYFNHLTLHEILTLFGSFYRKAIPPDTLLRTVDLTDKAGTTLRKLSGGQKQRFTLAASLVNDPEVVILDEPTTGLDPQARRNLWEFIRHVHSEGKTIVLTTHYMEEAQALCDRVAIMDAGSIMALDTPVNLLCSLGSPYVVKLVTSRPMSSNEAERLKPSPVDSLIVDGCSYCLRVSDAPRTLAHVLEWANACDVTLVHLEVLSATLEDVFLEITGKELRD
ncbi:MAG: ABC transporter ATP-binding protein [Dehalococcoidia bacterium]|nr:ABC transporter ATP-binding protein [Dehalococcoidia bacterium]